MHRVWWPFYPNPFAPSPVCRGSPLDCAQGVRGRDRSHQRPIAGVQAGHDAKDFCEASQVMLGAYERFVSSTRNFNRATMLNAAANAMSTATGSRAAVNW